MGISGAAATRAKSAVASVPPTEYVNGSVNATISSPPNASTSTESTSDKPKGSRRRISYPPPVSMTAFPTDAPSTDRGAVNSGAGFEGRTAPQPPLQAVISPSVVTTAKLGKYVLGEWRLGATVMAELYGSGSVQAT